MDLLTARRYVAEHHRHNEPPSGWKFGVGLQSEGELIGVAMAGQPVARLLNDGFTLEITRVCTNGQRNANSMLYGAIVRAAKALGYRRLYTYTLAEEAGTSLKASGWTADKELAARKGWNTPSRPRYETNLFGEKITPHETPKIRWIINLTGG